MIATVTSKGQVTLPKEIRDALGIEAGTRLDFRATGDGRIEVRKVEANPLAIMGLLKRLKRRRSVSVEEMNEAVLKEAAAASGDRARHQRARPASGRGRR